MDAVILAGGLGTRLRPYTYKTPKPLMPLLNVPIVVRQAEFLRLLGATRLVVLVNVSGREIVSVLRKSRIFPRIQAHYESRPLGTGGAVRSALDMVQGEWFFVMNGDVCFHGNLPPLTSYGESVIVVHEVTDATGFGLVRCNNETIEGFIEKPGEPTPGFVNAGLYRLSRQDVMLLPGGESASLERDLFPELSTRGRLRACVFRGYWSDLGTHDRYLKAHYDLMREIACSEGTPPRCDFEVIPPCCISPEARISRTASIGPYTTVGAAAVVGEGASVRRSVILPGARVRAYAEIEDAIVGDFT
ncbi:MAG: NDP-sugar synthase [Bacillota bacterium]